jgi:hypothetical protein
VIAGDTKPKLLILQDPSGANLSYASKAAFQAAGFNLTWYDNTGTALAAQPTWTIADQGNGIHMVAYAVPSGFYWVKPTLPTGTVINGLVVPYTVSPTTWANEGEIYDADAIAGLLLTAQGVPVVNSADDGDLGDVVEGDSFTTDSLEVPLGSLTKFGFSDLTGFTISASLMKTPNGTEVAINSAIVSTSARTVKAYWDSFPAALALTSGTQSQEWFLDIQLVNGTKKLTPLRYALNVVWQRDTV